MINTFIIIALSIIIYFILLNIWYTILLLASFPEVLKKFREATYGNIAQLMNQNKLMPITVVTPMYNEEDNILNLAYSVLNSDYKNVNLIIVNDGSTDQSMTVLREEFQLFEVPVIIKQTIKTAPIKHAYLSKKYSNLLVLDKQNAGYQSAGDAVNAGLNACKTPIMLTIDADTVIEPEALTRLLFEFLSNPHCVVLGGSIYVLNENEVEKGILKTSILPRSFIPAVQSIEYLRSFLYGRAGLNVLGGSLCYAGAFSLFETQVLREVGGFDTINFAYDAEITTKIHHYMIKNKYPHTLSYTSSAFSWTEVPADLKSFWIQRDRWHRGMWRSVFLHGRMFLNPLYGTLGLINFPFYIIFDILGPVVEFLALIFFFVCYFFGLISLTVTLWFVFWAWGFITFISMAMVFLSYISFNKYKKTSDIFKMIWLIFAEMFGFRQYRSLCCTVATFRYFINRLIGKPL